jgi:hypothetical protein
MNNRMIYLLSFGACFALFGCASEQPRVTGFLSDYSILKPHPTIQGALVYRNPDIDFQEYTAILVEPVELHFMDQNEKNRAKPEELAAFRRFVHGELTAAISKHSAIVTEPGPNVLRYRLQVSNLRLTQLISDPYPVWSTRDYALGTAYIETAAHDSVSGELVLAYVSPRGSVERVTTFMLAKAPDHWEAAKIVVRNHIVTISYLDSPQVVERGDCNVANYSQ